MTDHSVDDPDRFELGDVLGRGFSAPFERFADIALISILFVLLPGVVVHGADYLLTKSGILPSLVVIICSILFIFGSILLPIVLIQIFVRHFWGERVTADAALKLGLKRVWLFLGAIILAGLAILLGLVLLIVPGIILYCGWYVVIPVIVGERVSVTESLSRSWSLTQGYKGQIFVVFLLVLLASVMLGAVLGGITGALVGLDAVNMTETASPASALTFAAVQSIASLIGSLISMSLVASTYVELRRLEDYHLSKADLAL